MGAHTMAPQAPSATTTPVRTANRQYPWREGGKTNPEHPTYHNHSSPPSTNGRLNQTEKKTIRPLPCAKGGGARCTEKRAAGLDGVPPPLHEKEKNTTSVPQKRKGKREAATRERETRKRETRNERDSSTFVFVEGNKTVGWCCLPVTAS